MSALGDRVSRIPHPDPWLKTSSAALLPLNWAGPDAPPTGLGVAARAPPPLLTFLPAGPESHGQLMSWGLHDCSAGLVLSLSVTLHIPQLPGSSPLLQGASLSTLPPVCTFPLPPLCLAPMGG